MLNNNNSRNLTVCSFVGDIYAPSKGGRLSWRNFFDNFHAPLRGSDLVIANYEAPIAEDLDKPRQEKLYNLYHHPESLDLFDDRFVLSLANNHMMDYGQAGLISTIEHLNKRGIAFAGAGRNLEEASRPAFVERNGMTVAVVCAADPRFHPAGPACAGTMPADPELLSEVLKTASETADRIVVSIHAGMEFTRVPTPFMQRIASLCVEHEVSVVAFHHAHCISGHSRMGATEVFWGLGNYCFPKVVPVGFSPWFDSATAHVKWESGSPEASVEFCPVRLDSYGLPIIAAGEDDLRIRSIVSRCSGRIARGRDFRFWRIGSMLRPSYLRLAWVNYCGMIREVGVKGFFRFFVSTTKLYLKGGQK